MWEAREVGARPAGEIRGSVSERVGRRLAAGEDNPDLNRAREREKWWGER